MKRVKSRKAVDLDDIPMEVRCLGDRAVDLLTTRPDSRSRVMVQSLSNYRGINLTRNTKVWERVVEASLRTEMRISKQHDHQESELQM